MKFTDLVPWRREGESVPVRRDYPTRLESFHREIDRLFDSFFEDFDLRPFRSLRRDFGAFAPNVDVKELEDRFILSAELPGVDENDIEISLTENSITIRGEKKAEKEEKKGSYYYHECSQGTFERHFPLPAEVNRDKVEASLKKGVLEITLPKTEKAKEQVKTIPVNVQ